MVGIPPFIISKGRSDIFIPLLTLANEIFLSLWKETAIILVFNKGDGQQLQTYIHT
jgi:hypothetical protein